MKYLYNKYLNRYAKYICDCSHDPDYIVIICYRVSDKPEYPIRAKRDNCHFFATKGEMINSIESDKRRISVVLRNAKKEG